MKGTEALPRLKQSLDYVAAAERDRLAIPAGLAGEKGLRAAGAELLLLLPGIALNGGADCDPLWIRSSDIRT
jgi:hypothetical protein